MADSRYEVLKISFEFEPEYTKVEVICGTPSDGMVGIQGSHRAKFPPSMSALEILRGPIAKAEYLVSDDWS